MKDLNFFEPYIDKADFKMDKGIIFTIIASLILVIFVFNTMYNVYIINQKTKRIESLKATAENPESLARIEAIEDKKDELEEFRRSIEKIDYLDENIEARDIISKELLDFITEKMPEDLFLTYLDINRDGILLNGRSKDKLSVAKFEKGLEDLDDLEDIFITGISEEDQGGYNFTIDITLKGADLTEDEREDEQSIEEDEG